MFLEGGISARVYARCEDEHLLKGNQRFNAFFTFKCKQVVNKKLSRRRVRL